MRRTVAANDLAIKAAAPIDGKKTEYRIEGVDRLALMVEKSGSASFWLRYSVAGRDKRVRIGKRGVNSWKEVRAKAAEINASIERGDDPHAVAVVAAGAVTVGELWDKWKAAHQPPVRSAKTVEFYEQALKTFVWPEIGKDEMAGEVTAVRVANLVRKVAAKSKSRGHAVRSVISTMYSFGVPDLVPSNPAEDVRTGAKKGDRTKRSRIPSADEIGKLWNALEDGDRLDRRTVVAMKLLLLTGQRNSTVAESGVSELAKLAAANPTWVIPKERMKKEREQVLPLTSTTAGLFREALEIKRSDDLVFGYDKDTIGHAMRRLTARLKIDDLNVHDFRRGLNTWCAENGVSYDVRTRIMAHELPDVNSRVYNLAAMLEPMREALQRWEVYVLRCAEGVKGNGAGKVVPLVKPAAARA